jgi:hypothetical protein
MPNRIIREGILTSPRVARLGWAEEVFYRRLMSVVDDFGRYYADHGMLRAACYPRQLNKVSDSDVGKWLCSCTAAALVRVYPAKDGERYLQLLDFRQQTRAKASKFPDPLSECAADATQVPIEGQASAPVFVFGDVVEVEVETPPTPSAEGEPSRFEEFWGLWPAHKRKVAKDQCEKKWGSKECDAIAERVLSALKAFKLSDDWRKDGGEFIPSPLVWLNQARWEAHVETAAPSNADESIAAAQRWMAEQRLTPEQIEANKAAARALRERKQAA